MVVRIRVGNQMDSTIGDNRTSQRGRLREYLPPQPLKALRKTSSKHWSQHFFVEDKGSYAENKITKT